MDEIHFSAEWKDILTSLQGAEKVMIVVLVLLLSSVQGYILLLLSKKIS